MDIDSLIAEFSRMTVGQLRQRYLDVFGEPTRSGHKQHLIRRIAWRLQALAEGDLSERARRRAVELANDADLRIGAPPSSKTVANGENVVTPFHVDPDERLPMRDSNFITGIEHMPVRFTPSPKQSLGESAPILLPGQLTGAAA